jgi:AAA15 family ATPase/GTPase
MEIEIKNFGPISHLKFDLRKDLHLIYGKNAIGKSYATYCIYCLIKNIKNKQINYYYRRELGGDFEKTFRIKIKSITESKTDVTSDYTKFVKNQLKEFLIKDLKNSLQNTFSLLNLKNQYSNKNFEIILHITKNEKLHIVGSEDGELDLKFKLISDKYYIVKKNTKSTKFSLYKNSKMLYGKPDEDEFIDESYLYFFRTINIILARLDFNIRDIYYLPASRSGLYQALSAFTPILAELTQNRFFIQNKSIELPSLTEPLSDYFIDLSTLDKNQINREFEGIIELLQNEILTGEVDYDEESKRILYKPQGTDLQLNLSQVSSMVAELSPLVLYFKHIINHKFSPSRRSRFTADNYYEKNLSRSKKYDIIFIEEPEAHLHPEVQVKLIEIFAKLSNLRLKIFITSHSNYMFNKLNNLIIKKEFDADKVKVYHLVKKEFGTVLNEDMKVSKDGILDENFQDVTESLYYERLNYLENNDSKN